MPDKPKSKNKASSGRDGTAGASGGVSDGQLMNTRQLMEFLNLSRTKVWELVTKEGLPAFKIGGEYRYRQSEVVAWLEKYRVSHDNDN